MSEPTEIQLLHPSELPHGIKVAFETIYDLESQIADLMEKHIKPLQRQRTKEWRRIKAASNISRKTLSLAYAPYAHRRDSENTETKAEGERIRMELKKVFQACKIGEVLDFLVALDQVDVAPAPARKHPANGAAEEAAVSDKLASVQAPHAEPITPAEPAAPKVTVDNDWSAEPTGTDVEMTDVQKSGYDFNFGEKAGLAGKDLKTAWKEAGFHGGSNRGKQVKKGWEQGSSAREKQLAEVREKASNVEQLDGSYQAKQGREDGLSGKTAAECPYPEGSSSATVWERHRQAAQRELEAAAGGDGDGNGDGDGEQAAEEPSEEASGDHQPDEQSNEETALAEA